MSTKYTDKDIQVLSDRDHCRLRLPVYAGSTQQQTYNIPIFVNDQFKIEPVTFTPAAYKCINEIIDNAYDELSQIDTANKTIKIKSQPILATYSISDNGRGVPITKHESGLYTPQVVFGSLRSGRNFKNNKQAGVIGTNGMGSCITNFCSAQFEIDIVRDGKRYKQQFSDGALKVGTPSVRKTQSSTTGTTISFQLDNTIFPNPDIDDILLHNRAMELALTNPGFTVHYNNHKYKFKKGFDDVIKKMSNHYFKFEHGDIQFYVIFDVCDSIDENIFSWVNSSLLFDGGTCNAQFTNVFYDATIKQLSSTAKKLGCDVTRNDVRHSLLILGNLKISDPQYDAQSKTRLTGPSLRKQMEELIEHNWSSFTRKNKLWLQQVIDRAQARHTINANKKALKQHKQQSTKKIKGLIDATSKNRSECQLLVTEGDSAAAMITQVRNPRTTASLPLRGKINNVYGCNVSQLLKMSKVVDLTNAIGLIPGQPANLAALRYSRVVIATDSDVDGGDIFTLLVNLFYTYWPELFNSKTPFVYRLIAPNVSLTKNKNTKHFATRQHYEQQKGKYKGWTVNYYKGLGSMSAKDWKMVLDNEQTLIPITNDGNLQQTLKLLFSNDTQARKDWLQQ